jgi:biotin synthesis protein BioG
MDPAPFGDILPPGHDFLLIYDYTQLEKTDPAEITGNRYDQLHLIAWSMGVWAAATVLDRGSAGFASTLAVNGTLTPIDDASGIGTAAYNGMIHNFTADTLLDFYDSMFTGSEGAARFMANRPDRSRGGLLSELTALRDSYLELGPGPDIYGRKIVGSRDRIFSARNQLRAWERENCNLYRTGHFPFYDRLFRETMWGGNTRD